MTEAVQILGGVTVITSAASDIGTGLARKTLALGMKLVVADAPLRISPLAPGPVQSGIFDDPFGGKVDLAATAFVDTLRGMLSDNGLTPGPVCQAHARRHCRKPLLALPPPGAIDPLSQRRAAAIADRSTPPLLNFSEL